MLFQFCRTVLLFFISVLAFVLPSQVFATIVPPTIIGQPTSVLVSNSATASFTVSATGTAPLSYEWFLDGTALAGGSRIFGTATNTLVVSNAIASDAGMYSVVVSNSAGAMTSAPVLLAIDVPVKTLPSVSFGSPTPNEKINVAGLTLSGTAKSALGLAAVWYRLNGGAWTPATTSAAWSNWAGFVTLAPYANTIEACAADAAANLSAIKVANVTYTDTAALILTTNISGTVSPNLNGQSLQIGKSYTITAKPKAGYVFSGWTLATNGNSFASSASPVLTFNMQSGLQLTPNFTVNPEPLAVSFSVSTTNVVEGGSFMAKVSVKNTDTATLNGVYVAEEALNIAAGSTGFAVPAKFISPVIASVAPGKSVTFAQSFKATTAGTIRLYCDINSSLGASGTNYSPTITIFQSKIGVRAETDESGNGQVVAGGISVPVSLHDEETGSSLSGFALGLALDPNRKGQAVLAAIDTAGRYPPQFFLLRGATAPTESAVHKSGNGGLSLTQPVSLPVDQPCGGAGAIFQNIMTPVTTTALPNLASLTPPPSPSTQDTAQPAMSVVLDALESAGVAAKNLAISKKEVECDEVLADDAAGLAAGQATDVLFGELPEKFLEELAPGTSGIYTAYMTADTANAYYQSYRDVGLCNGPSSPGVVQQTTLVPSLKPYFESSFLTWNSPLGSEETPLQLVTASVQTTDENGNPISGGSIEMFSTNSLGSGFKAVIEDGTADLPVLANDEYSGCVRVPGYVTQSEQISVGSTNTVIQVKMEPQPVKSATLTTALGQPTGFLANGTQFTLTPHFFTSSNTEVSCTGTPVYYVRNPVGSTVATVDSSTGVVTIEDGCGAATAYVWCNGIESAPLLVSSDCNGDQPPAAASSFVVNPAHLGFLAIEGQGNPGSQTVFVVDLGSNTLNYTATANQSWIGVSAGNGTATVSVDASGLSAGTYSGGIDFVDTAATQNHAEVGVTLVVKAMPSSGGGSGSKFAGVWSGTYTGIYTYTDGSEENPFAGGVVLTIADGVISASSPVEGSGTVDGSGNGSWQYTPDEDETPFIFTGTFTTAGTASGTWTVTIPISNGGQSGSGSGTWTASREAIP